MIEHEPPNLANSKPIEGLAAWRDFVTPGATYSSGAHIAVVEVDPETGEVHILSCVAVDDCGRIVNLSLVEAQAQGGQALYEEVKYNEASGALFTSTLMDYALPRTEHNPALVTDTNETPSPLNSLGARGVMRSGLHRGIARHRRRRAECTGASGHQNNRHATHAGKGVGAGQTVRQARLKQPGLKPPPVITTRAR